MGITKINELKESYYEYIVKIPQGINRIISMVDEEEYDQIFQSIANLAEGLEALILIEKALANKHIVINSRIFEANNIFEEIIICLESKNLVTLKNVLKDKLYPLFLSASEWVFVEKKV